MSLIIKATELLSRKLRLNTLAGKTGSGLFSNPENQSALRKINNVDRIVRQEQGGFLQKVWNVGKTLLGWASSAIGFVGFSFGSLYGFLIGAVEELKAFNWNASDAELERGFQSQKVLLASLWGGAFGSAFGWVASIGVGYGIGVACPVIGGAALARAIAAGVAEEALDEVSANFRSAITQTVRVFGQRALTGAYINYRKLFKKLPLKVLEGLYGEDTARFIKNEWGRDGGPRISFNESMDQFVESFKNPVVEAFLEEFFEESWDAFVEAGFIISQALDEAYQQAKAAQQEAIGTVRSVQLIPDSRAEEEKLTFEKVPQNLLIPAVQQTINTHRLVHNRDVGQVVGQPLEEALRAKPQSLRLAIQMFSVPAPPWIPRAGQSKVQRVTLTIPDVSRAALDWERIKLACGGKNGYTWGRYRATALLDNGRQMAVYGSTEEAAKDRLKALLALSTAELLTLSVSEEQREGSRATKPQLYKEPTRVYPGFVTILNRQAFLDSSRGRATARQNFKDRRIRIPLWTDTKPDDFETIVREMLTFGTL